MSDPTAGESHMPSGRLRLGTQGWHYGAWVGPFYPPGTRAVNFLRSYARAFDCVEVDSTLRCNSPGANRARLVGTHP